MSVVIRREFFLPLLSIFAVLGAAPVHAQVSIGGGAGTGVGLPGATLQFNHLRGSVGVSEVGGAQYTVWEAAYVSVRPGTTDVFFWKIGGGVVGAQSVNGELEKTYYGGSGLLMYSFSLSESLFINLGGGVTISEEEIPVFNQQVFPAFEATLSLQI